MTTPDPLGSTSCAAPSESSSVAAPQDLSVSSNLRAPLSRLSLDTADPRPLCGDAPSRKRGRLHPDARRLLNNLYQPAAPLDIAPPVVVERIRRAATERRSAP